MKLIKMPIFILAIIFTPCLFSMQKFLAKVCCYHAANKNEKQKIAPGSKDLVELKKNNKIYVYDPYGRLCVVKDVDGKVVTRMVNDIL